MDIETVSVTQVRHGDVIRDPQGGDFWRQVRELGFDTRPKEDDSGEHWDLYVFIGPLVTPPFDPDELDHRPGFGRFVFREDEPVVRRVAPEP